MSSLLFEFFRVLLRYISWTDSLGQKIPSIGSENFKLRVLFSLTLLKRPPWANIAPVLIKIKRRHWWDWYNNYYIHVIFECNTIPTSLSLIWNRSLTLDFKNILCNQWWTRMKFQTVLIWTSLRKVATILELKKLKNLKIGTKKTSNHFFKVFQALSSNFVVLVIFSALNIINYLSTGNTSFVSNKFEKNATTWIDSACDDVALYSSCKWRHKQAKEIRLRLFAVVYILVSLTFFYGSAAYFWKWMSVDFKTAFFAIWQIIISVLLFYGLIFMLFSRYEIKEAFDTLSDIYNASKNQFRWKFVEKFGFLNKILILCDFT